MDKCDSDSADPSTIWGSPDSTERLQLSAGSQNAVNDDQGSAARGAKEGDPA